MTKRNSLVYRLRRKGWRIDTKKRQVFVTTDGSRPILPPVVMRLCDEFGFKVQTAMDGDDRKSRVYISGPISHYDLDERRRAFARTELMLRRRGYMPVNPMRNGLPQPGDWHNHMCVDIRNLLTCRYIFLMPEWETSKGCRLELDVAMSCGLQILRL